MMWFLEVLSDISNFSSSHASSTETAVHETDSEPQNEDKSVIPSISYGLGIENKGLEPESIEQPGQQILQFPRPLSSIEDKQLSRLAEQDTWTQNGPRPRALSASFSRAGNLRGFIRGLKKEPEIEAVEIRRGYKGELGFMIEGGVDEPRGDKEPGIFVKSVMPGTHSYGKVLPGDRILSVNGVNIANATRKQAKLIISKAMSRTVQFTIKRASKRQQTVDNALTFTDQEAAKLFSREQIEEFEDAFSVYNKDGSDNIKTTLVFNLIRSLGHNPPEHEVWEYLNELGLTANSKLKFRDFVKLMAVIITEQNTEKEINSALNVFDTDQRGYITVEELVEAIDRMPGRSRIRDWELKEIVRKADPAQRGMIPIKEFRNLLLPSISLY